ncbi:MAG: hypothetical protein ACOYB1_18745 [Limnohabitans sp.]
MKKIVTPVTWQEINGPGAAQGLPDADQDILIYDGCSDDTYKGYLDTLPDGSAPAWISHATGDPLKDPQFWAQVPFPDVCVKANLPEIGEAVDSAKLIKILHTHGKQDILDYLDKHGWPEGSFISDGCSMWPDSWRGSNLYPACFFHDVRYWCGMPGDVVARVIADAELAKDVVTVTGNSVLARTMFAGVGCCGTDYINTTFRWGYGR